MGVERREVAAGARGDPAPRASRTETTAGSGAGSGRARRAAPRGPGRSRRPGCAPTATRGRPRARGRAPLTSIVTTPANCSPSIRPSTPPTTLVPPPNGITAAPAASAQSSASASSCSVARAHDDVGRVVEATAECSDDVAVGTAVGVERALVGIGETDLGERRRRTPGVARAVRPRIAARVCAGSDEPNPSRCARNAQALAAPLRRAARPRTPSPSASVAAPRRQATCQCVADGKVS